MIDSPTHLINELQTSLKCSSSVFGKRRDHEREISKKSRDLVRNNAINLYFLRISWLNKLNFLTNLVKSIRSVGSLSLLLNTLYATTGKITSYCKVTNENKFVFDKILNDHNRMLNQKIVDEMTNADLVWFESVDDREQIACLIGLLRFAGGAITEILYQRIQKLYAQRTREISRSDRVHSKELQKQNSNLKKLNNKDEDGEELIFPAFSHDPKDPNHIKCEKETKKWKDMIASYRKKIETATEKAHKKKNEGKKGKKNDDKKKKSKKKGKKNDDKKEKSKKKGKKKGKGESYKDKTDTSLDWIQIMPIWIVKKIFSYLDKKTLKKAQKVNDYWKWAIKELFQDLKTRKNLNKTNGKFKAILEEIGEDCCLPVDAFPEDPKQRISFTEKRIKKLMDRGAILEQLRHTYGVPLEEDCLIIKALQDVGAYCANYVDEISMYPRVARNEVPLLYEKPTYICKDYKIICEEQERNESQKDIITLNRTHSVSGRTSMSSVR